MINVFEAAVSVVVISDNFLSVFAVSNPLPLYVTTCMLQKWQQTGGGCSLLAHLKTELPLYEVLCPHWIKWTGISEMCLYLVLNEQQEERHGLVDQRSVTVVTVGI